MITLLTAALVQATPCATLDACYAEAAQQVDRVVGVQYEDVEITQTATVVDCQGLYVTCTALGDAVSFGDQTPWEAVSSISGQGFDHNQNGNFTGYYALRPLERITLNRTALAGGFTIAVTVKMGGISNSQRVLALLDASGQETFAVDWTQGWYRGPYFLWLNRRATTGEGAAITMQDRPWDFDSRTGLMGPREFRNGPSPNSLYEIYLTFRTDGKVEVDWFSVSNTTRDFLISHLQDTGAPVESYPVQPAEGSWSPPVYHGVQTLVVGEGQQTYVPILQAVYFRNALTLDQRIAFHGRNLFFNMRGKEGTAHLAVGQKPCNSGGFLQPGPDPLQTVCGPRARLRASDPGEEAAVTDE